MINDLRGFLNLLEEKKRSGPYFPTDFAAF